ncbi:DUF1194 domain-containing protein [Roseovarius phycicola]|uniref:DUF1194 domain-containing protein n=1 Tax=Roseovarius phycicola TaxID=3080976 RepID=A0ABZ2HK25_9RHOB
MIRTTLFALAVLLATSAAQAQCRQALALGLDVSGSVDAREYRLQLDGLATALTSDDVRAAFLALPERPVRLMIYEWSGLSNQRIITPWTTIRYGAELDQIAANLLSTNQRFTNDATTAIAAAMLFGASQLAQQSECWKKTLDISGDGPANVGAHPQAITEEMLGEMTINGLVIGPKSRANTTKNLNNVKSLLTYYSEFVLRGPGAFVESSDKHKDFAEAMRRKLIRELRLPNLSLLRPTK